MLKHILRITGLVIGLVIGIPLLLLSLWVDVTLIDKTFGDIRAGIAENAYQTQLRADLKASENKWSSQHLTDYRFTLYAGYGGSRMWEGFGGISTPAVTINTIQVEVRNGEATSMVDVKTGNAIGNSQDFQGSATMQGLFSIIDSVLNGTETTDLQKKVPLLTPPPSGFPQGKLKVDATFDPNYGYPTAISVYTGNRFQRIYQIWFILRYQVRDFAPSK